MHGTSPLLTKVVHPQVGVVEVAGVDGNEPVIPRVAGLVHLPRIAPAHVRVESGDRLYHRKPLADAVGRQRLELPRPLEPLAQAHPPGVGEPEEGRAVDVLEVPSCSRLP